MMMYSKYVPQSLKHFMCHAYVKRALCCDLHRNKTFGPRSPITTGVSLRLFCSKPPSEKNRETFDEFRTREVQKENTFFESKQKDNTDEAKISALKNNILNAALNFVPSHGWSKQAIAKGAESINYPSVTSGLFPRNGFELVQHFYKQCNENLVEYLKSQTTLTEKTQNPAEFARKAIEIRLRMLSPYIRHWPQALGLMALPPNAPTSLANVLTLVDDICYYAGDRSVDFNWYTRRIGLASIYKATELYMMQDSSPDFEKTWKFLERRMEEATLVHDFLLKSEDATMHLQNAVGSAFSTARNILGLNFNRR
ncbi:ubiquinone biosynthesis protein COQ9, mitochondrial-like isoform X2 [Uranotaenia lowii]|uniref:ubiquinone biosynthesis protein COQ9, mitochondrial-like isoform X2 n=1 Tax=Uranotaenia lowii TaxID=190385 RepID=UPI002479A6BD|nr:ubiquinone biosynthesis protein COQ9, mitochondrial-like isoform X2 [Uranotaenia lowii]